MPVAAFFQQETEAALIAQVNWLRTEVGIADSFFARLLNVDEQSFTRWKRGEGCLAKEQQCCLKALWHMVLHLLSFLNFEPQRLSDMFEYVARTEGAKSVSPYTPPWVGTSLRAYLEKQGYAGVQKVDQWAQAIRFADS
jgi:hypothetical protein